MDPIATFGLGPRTVEVYELDDLYQGTNRFESFITNFGDWHLSGDVAAAMGSDVTHLEWFHDTGELIAIGAQPRGSYVTYDTGRSRGPVGAVRTAIPGLLTRGEDGEIYETVHELAVPDGTRAAILTTIAHGPAVHELLWGWHHQHHAAGGWDWLAERLTSH